jgi:hypothetical protein
MIRRTWLPAAFAVSAAAALFWTTQPSGPAPVVLGRALTPHEQNLAVGQSGCGNYKVGSNSTACIIGATTCAPHPVSCCFSTPVNQLTACTGEVQNVTDPSKPLKNGIWTSIQCVGTYTTAPCECRTINRCRAGTATSASCGNRSWFNTSC